MNKYINLLLTLSIALSVTDGAAQAQHKKFMIRKGGGEQAEKEPASTTTTTTTTKTPATTTTTKTPATTTTTKTATPATTSTTSKTEGTGKTDATAAAPTKSKGKLITTPKSVLGAGSITTPSGLQYKDVKVGTGASPAKGQVIWVHYTGWAQPEGRKFDSSVDRGMPLNFIIGYQQVMQGWDEGVASMKVGGKRILIVPPDLGYGAKGTNTIPPDTTLKYEISLLSIGPKMPKIEMPKPDAQKSEIPAPGETAKPPAKAQTKGKLPN